VPATNNRTLVLLEIVETAPMDAGLVTVDAAAMAKEIAREGHVALYGIHFDTNKAEIKPESSAALVEIGKLLKADPALKLLVVGHTDSVGGYDPNMALSDRRAAAVLQELTTKHGVAAARLRAVGVGMASPVASNDTDEGRAKNRRVELVKQ
jgi:outer membrane protein OmpA-like peptidoglycan-associated protein